MMDHENEPDLDQVMSIWNCCDPCAFLCYALQIQSLPFDPQIKRTLDAFGWLNEDGFPDYTRMTREFNRAAPLSNHPKS